MSEECSEIRHAHINRLIGVVTYKKRKVKFTWEPLGISQGYIPKLIVTELLVQRNLHSWIHSSNSDNVPLKRKLVLLQQIADGMDALHSSPTRIIHHNLKSSNVLVMHSVT
jgi:serine/threonine protein kinase